MIIDGSLKAGTLLFGHCANLGITYASNVFTICGADGTALSATNPGYVCVPSATAGQAVALPITANVAFNDDSHASPSFPINMGCGITTTVDWAQDMPWFLGYYNKDNTSANGGFFFTRDPRMSTTPAVGYINDFTALGATAQSQNHICVISAHTDNATSVPCVILGSFRMRYDTTSDGWTVQTLSNYDGFGKFQQGIQFTYPLNQNGAAANSYQSNANPNTCSATMTYSIGRDGMVKLFGYATWAGAGAATNVVIKLPLAQASASKLNALTLWISGHGFAGADEVDTTSFQLSAADGSSAWTSAGITAHTSYFNGMFYPAF